MRCFIAGSGGYLGIPLCEKLAREGHEVVAFDRYFFGKKPSPSHGKITIAVGDIRDVSASDLSGCDAVVDLAGLSNDASCEIDPIHTKNINVDGAIHLIRAAYLANVSRYIYSSSASVYGHGDKLGLTEEDAVNPLTEYAKSKLAVEKFLQTGPLDHSRMDYVILRNATVFGYAPRMRFDLALNVMTARAMIDGVIFCMGGGEQWRPLVHVDDVVRTIVWSIANASRSDVSRQVFNVGSAANQMRIRSLAGMVSRAFPDAKIHMIPDNVDDRSYHLSFDKLKKAFSQSKYLTVDYGIWEVRNALNTGMVTFDDPATITVGWYKSMLDWNKRIEELKIKGRLL